MRRPIAILIGLALFAAVLDSCSKKGGGGGNSGIPVPTLGCGDQVTGALEGKGSPAPVFSDSKAIDYYQIDTIPVGATSLTISLLSNGGNANLHLAAPGSNPGSRVPTDYILASQEIPPQVVDTIKVSLVGLEAPSSTFPSPTLKDYVDGGEGISFAVWAVEPVTDYDLQITCENDLVLPCGFDVTGVVPGSATAPPDFAAGTEVHFYEVQGIPASPGAVSILLGSTSGDSNIYLGRPGLSAPSPDPADYIFSSTAPTTASANDLVLLDGTGLHDVFGFTNPLVTLQDYTLLGGTIRFAVAGLEASNEYTLRVTCTPVDPIGCASLRGGSVNGSTLSPPDLTNGLETRFFQIPLLSPTTTIVTITLNSISGDADLFLAAPGIAPGSDLLGDYVFSSEERSPAGQDQIVMDMTGLQDGSGGLLATVTLDDYLQAATPVGLAVTGFDPLTSFSLTLSCVAPPAVLPFGCGQTASFALAGPGAGGPDLTNISENLWFQLPSIPPGTNRIEISLSAVTGDVDIYLASPGTPPGSQNLGAYPVSSIVGWWPDRITICNAGTASLFGSQLSPTLADYMASAENLSFIIAGAAQQSDFTITVNCSSAPGVTTSTVVDCGSVTQGLQIDGSFQFPPDFDNTLEVHYYEVPLASVQGANAIRLRVDETSGGDIDLYLARPGSTPGSTCYSSYIFRDLSGGAADWIRIRASGLDNSGGGTSGAFVIGDYKAASTNLSFAVAGWTASMTYDLRIICN